MSSEQKVIDIFNPVLQTPLGQRYIRLLLAEVLEWDHLKRQFRISAKKAFEFESVHGLPHDIFCELVNEYLSTGKLNNENLDHN